MTFSWYMLDVNTLPRPPQTLLYDPNVTVRAVLVRGVGVIVSEYWEYLPNTTITWFINRLVADLAWDASSPEVRACVLQVRLS